MKVRVAYTVEVNDEYRRAIRRYQGKDGLAERDEVRDWIIRYGDSKDMELGSYDELAEFDAKSEIDAGSVLDSNSA